jgi:O-antigen ligase
VLAIVKTGSRGGLVGLALMGLVMLWTAPPRRRLTYTLAATLGIAVVMLTASDDLRVRMRSIVSEDKSAEDYNFTDRDGRMAIWKRGIGYMRSHPLIGVGVDSFETAELTLSGKTDEGYGIRNSAAHNSLVQIGAELGVFGLLAYLTAIVSACVSLVRARRAASAAARLGTGQAESEVSLTGTALTSLAGIVVTGFFLSFGYHAITMFVLSACIGIAVGSPFALGTPGAAAPPASPRALPRGWRMGDAASRISRMRRGRRGA